MRRRGSGCVSNTPVTVLERRESTAGRNPYMVIKVDGDIIPDHNDIDDDRVLMFLSQLILLSSQSDDPKLREDMRGRMRGQ